MNNKLILGLLAGAGAFYYFIQGKKGALENLIVKPTDIAISKESNILKLIFNLKLKISNPSKYAVKIKNIDLDLQVNGKTISDFNSSSILTLPANTEKMYTIKIAVNNGTIIQTILEVLLDKNINVAVNGSVTTDLGVIDIDFVKEINF
jgi:LEA14-like dessication related protein